MCVCVCLLLTHPACDRKLPPPRLSLRTPGRVHIQIHSSWSPVTPVNHKQSRLIRGKFCKEFDFVFIIYYFRIKLHAVHQRLFFCHFFFKSHLSHFLHMNYFLLKCNTETLNFHWDVLFQIQISEKQVVTSLPVQVRCQYTVTPAGGQVWIRGQQ